MKKVLAAALLCAASAFAAWDYFSVLEDGKGQGKVTSGGDVLIRYVPMANLELMAAGAIGSSESGFGARYQVGPLALGADFGWAGETEEVSVAPGLQFSTEINEQFSLGLGASFTIATTNEDPAMQADAGIEFDLALGAQTTLWVGCDVAIPIDDGYGESGDVEVTPLIGFVFSKDNLSLGASLAIGTNDDMPVIAPGVDFTIGF